MLMCVQGSIWVQRFDLDVRTVWFFGFHTLLHRPLVTFIRFPLLMLNDLIKPNMNVQLHLHIFCG